MKGSWRICRVAGIGVYIHVTFLLLVLFAAWNGYQPNRSWGEAATFVGFILVLFFIVVLHELGHALMARRFGIGTKDITLLPIGGVARLERMPEDPRQELAVALAGPAVNVALAILLAVGLALGAQFSSRAQAVGFAGGFFFNLLAANIFLAVFNMIPAFPMDGGRVLRALLATRLTYVRATRIAAGIGQSIAFLLGLIGLMGLASGTTNPFLILIAVFVWVGAAQESNMVQMKSALGKTRVSEIMITDYRTLAPEDTLTRAVEFLLSGYQQDFPVISEGKLVGILTRPALVAGLAKLGAGMPVADAMEKQFPIAHPAELAETLFLRLQSARVQTMPVVFNGQLCGMITSENVGEFLMVQGALHNEPRAARMGNQLSEGRTT